MRMLRANRNFMNRSENSCSSCMTRTISSRPILSAVQAVIAVADARREKDCGIEYGGEPSEPS